MKEGPKSLDYLRDLADRQEDGEPIDMCCELPVNLVHSILQGMM